MSWGAFKAALVGIVAGGVVTCAITLTAPGANAKSTYESPYGYDRTWNAAVRMVVVDNSWKVSEKDKANGYLVFDYKSPSDGKVSPGTLEFVRGEDDYPVSVLAQLPQNPSYHEQRLLDELASKMRREYGDPPPHKRPQPAGPDGGPDGGGD